MDIHILGGGPSALFLALLTKKSVPETLLTIYRSQRDSLTSAVCTEDTLSILHRCEPALYNSLLLLGSSWKSVQILREDESLEIKIPQQLACSGSELMRLLTERCEELGIAFRDSEAVDTSLLNAADYVVIADGISSNNRDESLFQTREDVSKCYLQTFSAPVSLEAFTYCVKTTPKGFFVAQAHPFGEGQSLWNLRCHVNTYESYGFDVLGQKAIMGILNSLFENELQGAKFQPLNQWERIPRISNRYWMADNRVLLGQAKASVDNSEGMGLQMALECAKTLSDALIKYGVDREKVQEYYEEKRRPKVTRYQRWDVLSDEWLSEIGRSIAMDFTQFAFALLTRNQKSTYETLGLQDRAFTDKVLTDYNCAIGNFKVSVPAAFTPIRFRGIQFHNRIAMASMNQYSCEKGLISDWHLVHYASRAIQGLGLVMTETTAVSKTGRITLGCAGIWNDNQVQAWKRLVDFVHKNSKSKIGIQLGHSGRKGSVRIHSSGVGKPLENKGWETLSASAIPFQEFWPTPKEMGPSDMEEVLAQYINAAVNADLAGFDLIELQAHHGYLLSSFISPLTNLRTDQYGGSLENRLKFPLHVFQAIREVFHRHKPIAVRVSASEWAKDGISCEEAELICQAFKDAGADIIHIATGNTLAYHEAQIENYWQGNLSDRIRNSLNFPTITSGNIQNIDQINTLLLSGKTDMVALGNTLLLEPNFVRNAQAHEGFLPNDIPNQYLKGVHHLFPLRKQQRQEQEQLKKSANRRN